MSPIDTIILIIMVIAVILLVPFILFGAWTVAWGLLALVVNAIVNLYQDLTVRFLTLALAAMMAVLWLAPALV